MKMKGIGKAVPYVILTLIVLPLLMMYVAFFLQSFSTQLTTGFIPKELGFSNFSFLWEPLTFGLRLDSIWIVLLNTVLFSVVSGGVVTVLCLLGAYPLSRITFRGRELFLSLQLVLHSFPGPILLIAVFFVLLYLKLLNTIPGVALARAALEVPLGIWILKGFFDGIPLDIERAAMVDGCNRFQVWARVFLPLIRPGIAAVFIWGALFAWHDFIYVFTLLGRVRLMSTLIQGLIATEVIDFGVLAALSLFYLLPPLVLFVFLQRAFMQVAVFGGKGAT
ncbi:MAG: carbohydrate ABC transporter permease [Candidatus Bipolaricaulia bacterium]